MHESVLAYVANAVETYQLADKATLEVGSLDVNGSPRHLFKGEHLGVDMRPGPNVDLVRNAHDLIRRPDEAGIWDVIVSTEMLEHDDLPWLSLRQMRYAARRGAILILTCRGYDERGCFPVHGYPQDHYRYSVTGITALLKHTRWTPLEVTPDPQAPGVLATARAA